MKPPAPETLVDLARPPAERWTFSEEQVRSGRDLFRIYNHDIGIDEATRQEAMSLATTLIPEALVDELSGISAAFGVSLSEVVLANSYYDLLKVVLGCTAFSVESPDGPLHARNLDWWTTERALNDGTLVSRFVNGPAGEFVTIGWPGFVGAFSGLAANRFAVTLNAVTSDEPGQLAKPVVMLLREVLETAESFDEAVDRLSDTAIASDCLLLVSGTENAQRVVIERTPTQHAHRFGVAGEPLQVTNDYLALEGRRDTPANELMATSCGRYDRIAELLGSTPPKDLETCLDLLGDDCVQMEITVQQMAFSARSGTWLLRVP